MKNSKTIAVYTNDFKNALTPLIHHLVDGVCFRERHLGILQKINHLVNVNWPWQWWLPILTLISISYIKLSFKTLLLSLKEINWQKTNRNHNLHTTNNEDIIQHDSLKQCKIEEFHPITIRDSQTRAIINTGYLMAKCTF